MGQGHASCGPISISVGLSEDVPGLTLVGLECSIGEAALALKRALIASIEVRSASYLRVTHTAGDAAVRPWSRVLDDVAKGEGQTSEIASRAFIRTSDEKPSEGSPPRGA